MAHEIYDVEASAGKAKSGEDYICFNWDANIGFGELTLFKDKEGNWKADTECMCRGEDKDFIREILEKWVEKITVIE